MLRTRLQHARFQVEAMVLFAALCEAGAYEHKPGPVGVCDEHLARLQKAAHCLHDDALALVVVRPVRDETSIAVASRRRPRQVKGVDAETHVMRGPRLDRPITTHVAWRIRLWKSGRSEVNTAQVHWNPGAR